MSKTIYVSSQDDCSEGQAQSNNTTVRLVVDETSSGYKTVLRQNPEQVVACIRQQLDLSPSEQSESSMSIVLRPLEFVPSVIPIGSVFGSATMNPSTNTITFVPPAEDHTDEWDFGIYTESGGQTTLVNRLRIRLIHI